ncbi:MAG: hypothetical protein HAW60_02740 [Bdellovibrionales bacterium]|nr:hypothetical protein [Bdellovibrionales bacterium]
MKKKIIISLLTSLLMLPTAFGFGGYDDDENGSWESESEPSIVAYNKKVNKKVKKKVIKVEISPIDQKLAKSLAGVFDKSKKDLSVVEKLLSEKKYSEALSRSKDLLDQIKFKTGINPKVKFREKIIVNGIFTPGKKNELKIKFDSLFYEQKENLARAVLNYRGGLYLDLLNLYKRTQLIYMKSFYYQIKKVNDLRLADIEKLKIDILLVHSIPILIKDKNLRSTFLLFDSDVSDSDQQYFFNRELVDLALSIKELNFTDETFAAALVTAKNNALKKHWNSLPEEPLSSFEIEEEKRKDIDIFNDYKNCRHAAEKHSSSYLKAMDSLVCVHEYKNVLNLPYSECESAANLHDNSYAQATDALECHNK